MVQLVYHLVDHRILVHVHLVIQEPTVKTLIHVITASVKMERLLNQTVTSAIVYVQPSIRELIVKPITMLVKANHV